MRSITAGGIPVVAVATCGFKGVMKILVRDAERRMWRDRNGAWTCDLQQAAQFASLSAAGEAATGVGEREVEVVLRYEEESCELALNPAYCVARMPHARASCTNTEQMRRAEA